MKVILSARTDTGRVRGHNEDAYIALDLAREGVEVGNGPLVEFEAGTQGVVVGVSDGMGGAQAGEIASAMVVQSLDQSLREKKGGDTDDVLKAAVERANREVHEAARSPGRKGMGATLTAVLLRGTYAHIASVGDSRAYLLRRGRLRQMTRDQSYVQVLLDAGLIEEDEAEESAFASVILQSMGQKEDVQVALGRLELREGDRLFICSDGITAHVKDDDLSAILGSGRPPDQVTQELVDLANERGGTDNMTAVVADLTGGDLRRPANPETVTQTFQVLSEFSSPVKKSGAGTSDEGDAEGASPSDGDGWSDEATTPSSPSAVAGKRAEAASDEGGLPASLILAVIALILIGAGMGYWLVMR